MDKRLSDEQLRARIAELTAKKAERAALQDGRAGDATTPLPPRASPQLTMMERVQANLSKRFPDHPGLTVEEFEKIAAKYAYSAQQAPAPDYLSHFQQALVALVSGEAEQRYFEAQQAAEKQWKFDFAVGGEGLQQLRDFAASSAYSRGGHSDAVYDEALEALNAIPDKMLREFYISLPEGLRENAHEPLCEVILVHRGRLPRAEAMYFMFEQYGFDSDRLFDDDPH